MGSNFKGSFKITLFSLFIALHLTNQFVLADLPKTDLRKATSCMRQFFGEHFLEGNTFLGEYTLTDGEYFGLLCPEIDSNTIRDLIRNKAQEDGEGTAIKECLTKINSDDLFEHYVKLGQNSENAAEHEKPAGYEDHQTPSTQSSDLLNTPILYFQIGVCKSRVKAIGFDRLTEENEKKETVQCLTKCADNFMNRITDYLRKAIRQVMNSRLSKQIESDPRMLKCIPNSSQEFTTEKFSSELEKANDTLSPVPITQIGKEYLVTYSKAYTALNKYVSDEERKSIIDLADLDHNLFYMLLVYGDCAALDCGIGSYSAPLYNLIESGAKDSYWKILQAFTNDNENLRDWIDRQTGDWKTFCKAFID